MFYWAGGLAARRLAARTVVSGGRAHQQELARDESTEEGAARQQTAEEGKGVRRQALAQRAHQARRGGVLTRLLCAGPLLAFARLQKSARLGSPPSMSAVNGEARRGILQYVSRDLDVPAPPGSWSAARRRELRPPPPRRRPWCRRAERAMLRREASPAAMALRTRLPPQSYRR